MKYTVVVLLVLLAGAPAFGQTGEARAGQDGGVDGILAMAQAGLSDDIIITKLRKDAKPFDLSPEQMIRLKKASLSDAVIRAMIDPKAAPVVMQAPVIPGLTSNPSGATQAAGTAAAGDPNDPTSAHDSGIYLYTMNREGKPEMLVLERAAYQGSKTGGMLTSALTYGIKKAQQKAVIPGPRASIRTEGGSVVFYFYFDDKAAGLGRNQFGGNISNPNQFALVKLDSNKSNRETTIMEIGAFGMSTGTNSKAMVGFKSERIRAGLYKVVPNAPLDPGEYCFMASMAAAGAYGAGAGGAVDLFDFGANPNR